ncbi:hypothetical protein [Actinopolymorpha pittospori]
MTFAFDPRRPILPTGNSRDVGVGSPSVIRSTSLFAATVIADIREIRRVAGEVARGGLTRVPEPG